MNSAVLMLLLGVTFGTYAAYLRGKLVAEAGALILRVVRPSIRLWTGLLLVPAAFFALLIVIFLQRMFEGSLENAAAIRGSLAGLCLLAVTLVTAISSRSAHLELREHGILVNTSFWPWAKVESFSWKDQGRTVRLELAGYGWVEYRIKAEQKEALNQLLEQHVRETSGMG